MVSGAAICRHETTRPPGNTGVTARMRLADRGNDRIGVVARMDNFTIAVLITIAPFALFVIYGLWSGKLRPDNEPHRRYRRDSEDAPGQPE